MVIDFKVHQWHLKWTFSNGPSSSTTVRRRRAPYVQCPRPPPRLFWRTTQLAPPSLFHQPQHARTPPRTRLYDSAKDQTVAQEDDGMSHHRRRKRHQWFSRAVPDVAMSQTNDSHFLFDIFIDPQRCVICVLDLGFFF